MIDQMLLSIVLIIASLFAGVAFGLLKKNFPAREKKAIALSMTGMVFALIFLMGIKTGINHAVMAGLGIYGIKSLLLALGAIAGSIIFVFVFDRLTSGRAAK